MINKNIGPLIQLKARQNPLLFISWDSEPPMVLVWLWFPVPLI